MKSHKPNFHKVPSLSGGVYHHGLRMHIISSETGHWLVWQSPVQEIRPQVQHCLHLVTLWKRVFYLYKVGVFHSENVCDYRVIKDKG